MERKRERLYDIWNLMKQRCNNPNRKDFQWYGAKGVSVCNEWLKYSEFKEWALENGYAETLTLDRKESDKDYSPNNCRWIPFSQQREHTTQSKMITIAGRTKNLKSWCEELGLNYNAVFQRIHRGMDEKDALILPIDRRAS